MLPLVLTPDERPVIWVESHKGSAVLRRLADRHYTRQTHGSNQVCRPGYNFTLIASDGLAAWNVWRPRYDVGRMDGLEAWECTLFRRERECPRLSSDLVREATHLTFCEWGWPPNDGLITSVGIEETRRGRSKNSPPGKCFIDAGWTEIPEKHTGSKAWLRAPHPMRTPRPADSKETIRV